MFRKNLLIIILLLLSFSIRASPPDTLTIMVYNLLNFPNSSSICGATTIVPSRWDTLRKIIQYVKPDIFMIDELQNSVGSDSILTRSLNKFGITYYKKANFVPNQSTPVVDQNMFFYNSNKVTLKSQTEIITDLRDVNVYTVYGNDPNLSCSKDTTFINFYVTHFKAGTTATDQNRRNIEANAVRTFVDAQPVGRNHIFGADFNFYTSTEAGYQTLTTGGITPFFDPISSPGSWTNNVIFAPIHTQSTRLSENYDCGAFGGLDDRFDIILTSGNVLSGANRVQYIPGTYKTIGNDGNHFNVSLISAPVNTSAPDSVIRALFYMSDHLPVIMKVKITYPAFTALALTNTKVDVNCSCEATGSIDLTVAGGTPGYTYSWNYGATTQDISGISAAGYSVTVTDSKNCIQTSSITINEPLPIAITLVSQNNISCMGQTNGQITVQASGGTSPYDFSIDGGSTYTYNNISALTPVAFNLLPAGVYVIKIRDGNNCITSP